ncbi:Ca-transporting ATPase [Rhizoctonia solani]|uniref:Cation-transporting ATPase n=1 Tax=Rhizoctonia solani TaxID=456999 RepID=A0A8H7LY76_9AGAM|nr:Ca-transporting ATPase [Rhizoctonia solani]
MLGRIPSGYPGRCHASTRRRRDSQIGSAYGDNDDEGAVFGGPQAALVPSSVSSFHRERPLWRRDSRRKSIDSRRRSISSRRSIGSRRASIDSRAVSDADALSGDEGAVQLESPSIEDTERAARTGMFASFTGLFRTETQDTRPGISRRTSEASSVGQWDIPLGSDVSGSPLPSPTASLPIITGGDPFFGDTRIDISPPASLYDVDATLPESRQNVYVADEDAHLRLTGYTRVAWRNLVWYALSILSLGTLALVGRWVPTMWLRFVAREVGFPDADFVVVETEHADFLMVDINTISYPYPLDTVFNNGSANPTPGHSTPAEAALTKLASRDPSIRSNISGTPANGHSNGGSNLNGSNSTLKPPAEINGLGKGEAMGTLSFVDYRYNRFVLDPRSRKFAMLRNWRDRTWPNLSSIAGGLTTGTRDQRTTAFGANEVEIEAKSTSALLIDEVLHPFYVFQIASILLWSLDDYYYYAFCIALISCLSVVTTLVETKKTIAKMREMSRFRCDVGVKVDGEWQTKLSSDLVPGDTISLLSPTLHTVPADILLISGDAIVNESMLTGESVPVSKIPVTEGGVKSYVLGAGKNDADVGPELAKSFLYAGTRVVRVRGSGAGEDAIGIVVRTGFNTTKGALVRSMLFPKPMGFKFYRDSMRFIGVLAIIAVLGFMASAVQFVKLGLAHLFLHFNNIPPTYIWLTTRPPDRMANNPRSRTRPHHHCRPPALPATLSIGTAFAISRLRKAGVFCIAPTRVNVGGKVDVVCFDKTGTLTEDGLDVLGVRGIEGSDQRMFGELVQSVHELPLPRGREKISIVHALTTCHQLKVVDGEVIGDPLDVKMFDFTGWEVEEGKVGGGSGSGGGGGGASVGAGEGGPERPATLVQTIVRPPGGGKFRLEDAMKTGTRHAHFLELGVIRTFEFVSALRRMSVVVKRLKSSSMEIYVKGAPEVMGEICDPESFPGDYEDMLSYYTKHGEQAESNLKFLGLIVFENKLKPGTAPAIQTLRDAHLVCRMVTGDNPRTAVSVARECGLISQSAHVFYAVFSEGNAQTAQSKLHWSSVDDATLTLDDYSLKPLLPRAHHTIEEEIAYQDYTLAVSGDVFRWMVNHAPLETLQRMLVKAQIFARMSPDEKHELVSRLQSLGYTVCFCGDGANDCGALKAADVGLSLSEAEASVAAPFTSRTPDIGCVIEVIREGRAALVTSFSCFKYMALYSLIQFTTVTLLYSFASSLGDFQFLYIDLFIIILLQSRVVGRTLPYSRIYPKRPTASLVSKKVLSSIIGQIVITSAFQFWAFWWVRGQEWVVAFMTHFIIATLRLAATPHEPASGSGELKHDNFENTALFLISSFQYVLVAAVFSIGPPYRKPMWTNGLLMASIVALTAFSTLVLLAPPQPIRLLLNLMEIPTGAKRTLLVGAILNAAICFAFERWNPVAGALEVVSRGRQRRVRGGLEYRAVEGGMVGRTGADDED